jgi:transcriptional regulator with XRE-family HTH domain
MHAILHKKCDFASPCLHERSSERFGPRRHNLCVGKKTSKNPLHVEMGRRLRTARKARKWSQAKLASQTGWSEDHPTRGIHPSSIAMCERGERGVTIEAAMVFSELFGLPPPYWLALIDEYEADVLQAIQKRPRTAVGGR